MQGRPIRLTAIIEAGGLTGPARNLLDFISVTRQLLPPPAAPITVSVITFDRSPERGLAAPPSTPFTEAVRALGADIAVVKERFRFDPSLANNLRATVDRQRPDLVETHSVKSHFLARYIHLAKRGWIAHHHGYTTTDARMRAYNMLDRWSLPAAGRVVTVCSAFRRELIGLGVQAERLTVAHSSIAPDWSAGLEPGTQSRLRSFLGLAAGEKLLLSVGRLSHEKGHVELVRAFEKLCSTPDLPRMRLVIVGDGPERRRLQAVADTLHVADRVAFAGYCEDVRPYFRAADLFVLPSYSEGSPIAALEAMVSGVPLVVTAVGGVPEMLSSDSAALVPPRDPVSIARAIAELIGNPERARKQAALARTLALERHRPEYRAGVLAAVYRQMIEERQRA